MENAIEKTAPQRDLDIVTNEIISLKNQAQRVVLSYIIEIGRKLVEAKALVPHGEWGDWLKNRVDFSQRTATNYIKIFEEYGTQQISLFGNSQPIASLDYTKALALLAVPRDERDSFIADNNVEDMSKRELEDAIRQRNEAQKKAAEADRLKEQLDIATAKASKAEREADAAKERADSLIDELEQLKNSPVPAEKIEEIKKEAEKDKKQAVKDAKEKAEKKKEAEQAEIKAQLEAAERAKAEAEAEAKRAQNKVAEIEKKLLLASPEIAQFQVFFDSARDALDKLTACLNTIKINNTELGAKLQNAYSALIGKYEVSE